ncbi:MAG: hypothetical protein WDO73_15070 [Ignavibacteriota bacterium]
MHVTVQMLDEVKNLGFLYATRAGISIGIDDMVVPAEKAVLVREAEKEVVNVESQYQDAPSPTASGTTRSSKSGRR